MDKKKIIRDFIRKNKLAVLCSINPEGKPQSAVLGFGDTDSLELIFGTFNNSRKYQNIKNNPKISAVIGWDENITVQYEGHAIEIDGDEKEKYTKLYYAKNPQAEKFQSFEEERYFKVIPKWIRYSDLNKDPLEIFEIEF